MKLIHKKNNINLENDTWKILLVDNEVDIHTVTRLSLKNFQFANKKLKFLSAKTAAEAREIIKIEDDIAVAFIDIVMETDDAGLRLVNFIRHDLGNKLMRLIIRTGQAGSAPERDVVDHYDIDDYKDKTELTSLKLYTTTRSALKSYRDLCIINENEIRLQKVLKITHEINKPRSIDDFFNSILKEIIQICNLRFDNNGAIITSGVIITAENKKSMLRASIGRFTDEQNINTHSILKNLIESFNNGVLNIENNDNFIPIENDNINVGFLYIENMHYLSKENRDLIHIIMNQCSVTFENLQLYNQLKNTNKQALNMLAVAAEFKDKDTGEHVNRIARNVMSMARELNMSENEIEEISSASILHDIGKLGIPDAIIQKPGELTVEEYEIIKTHPEIGRNILDKSNSFKLARDIAYSHHERWDGKGYPQNLKGKEIPLSARIVAIADTFDALIHKRSYKEAFSIEDTLARIKNGSKTQFDPDLVEIFLKLYNENKIYIE
jgi:response regulator RpfG family c-di-GMP phosphodiesterase